MYFKCSGVLQLLQNPSHGSIRKYILKCNAGEMSCRLMSIKAERESEIIESESHCNSVRDGGVRERIKDEAT